MVQKLLWDGPEGSIYPSLRVRPMLKVILSDFEASEEAKKVRKWQKRVFLGEKRVIFWGLGAPNDHIWGTWYLHTLQGTFMIT